MIDTSTFNHHPAIEEIAEVLSTRTQNKDLPFFRVVTAYMLSVVASCMRTTISTKDRGDIPVNAYCLALSPSGTGKGFSVNILENEIINGFRKTFVDDTLPELAATNIWALATKRAIRKDSTEEVEVAALEKEYEQAGAYPFVFDSGSAPAVKQVRQKLLLAGAGAINLQIDEIGSNLVGQTEVLNTYLELYDQGMIKAKLTKNTADNKRTEEIEGKTPSNMLLFGTPSRLLDGGATEDHFYSMLETGYARRCIFAMGQPLHASMSLSPTEIYKKLVDPANRGQGSSWATHLTYLADINKFGWVVDMPEDVAISLLTYRIACQKAAQELPEFDEIRRTEMEHRYFKALKLAGALAYVDEALQMDITHLEAAIKLTEESGAAFQQLLQRETSYMKLARYVAGVGKEVTHADLFEALPFYKSSASARNEMMTLATAWGFKHHIMVKKTFVDGIEFFEGETLKETNIDEIGVAYSDDFAYGYAHEYVPFSKIDTLTSERGFHWTNHAFTNEHRREENVIPGFNTLVLDVDEGVTLQMAHELLADYTFMTYTTKRHTPEKNRFRILLPTNYQLKLDEEDYKQFMENVVSWLPFKVDEAANQRSRKWMSNDKGQHFYSQGTKLLDVLPFVPKTSKNEHYQQQATKLQSLDNLERWFAERIASGNRNNQMIKFALALVDNGMDYAEVETKVMDFNQKLSNGLSPDELRKTVLVTVARKLQGTP